jgi:hypothetical protein
MLRLRVSKDEITVECPAAHREILTTSCSRTEDDHCECFQGLDSVRSTVYVLCDYGFEDRQMSIIVPSEITTEILG